jgi:hypothetical protein
LSRTVWRTRHVAGVVDDLDPRPAAQGVELAVAIAAALLHVGEQAGAGLVAVQQAHMWPQRPRRVHDGRAEVAGAAEDEALLLPALAGA